MGRNRKRDKEVQSTLNNINKGIWAAAEGSRATAEATAQTNEKLDKLTESSRATAESTALTNEQLRAIKSDTEKSSKSKLPLYSLIVAVITLVVAISGYSVKSIIDGKNLDSGAEPTAETVAEPKTEVAAETEPETETKAETEQEIAAEESAHTIYLYSEYNPVELYVETEITATLNFETDAVAITAYLASGEESTLPLERKNATEWQKKVQFTETGVHKVVVTAETSDGETIENSIEVEVIPLNIDIDMDTINQFLPTGL